MPTYQYSCVECGHFFEQFQGFSDDSLTECPSCAGRLRKVFNAVGVVFKGSGFYRNDSRSGPSTGEAGSSSSEGKPEKATAGSSAPSSDSGSSSSDSSSKGSSSGGSSSERSPKAPSGTAAAAS